MSDAEYISLKQHFDELRQSDKDSIDRRFAEIFERFVQSEKAVASALVSQKELYQTVQGSSDKAITKAESAQTQYNQGHNDLSRKMEDQYKMMLPRTEAQQSQANFEEKLEAHRKELAILTSKLDEIRGKGLGIQSFYGWIIAAIAVIFAILEYFKH